MRRVLAVGVGLGLLGAPVAFAQNSIPQMLQGLMTGNQSQDRALRDAYERGYRQGRADEARFSRDRGQERGRGQDRYEQRRGYGNQGGGYER